MIKELPDKMYQRFILNIKYIREQKGITQIELANYSNVSRSTIKSIEHRGSYCSFQTAALIAFSLDHHLGDLLTVQYFPEGFPE